MNKKLEIEFPEEILRHLGKTDKEAVRKVKQSAVLELLRKHKISQGKASEFLGINRNSLFDLMAKYNVPTFDLSSEELEQELSTLKSFRKKGHYK
ncbi:MAG TPA: UPF0175 family protein [Candidatus Tripitaka californicus]|uniref:UPF0175 family protein n=1 Tax=Candidatus Tripitaka californicus TaxID=3367616 RepID=UPI004026DA97|nr:UPF0175 family protein [Planctomycetota bacterium]